MAHKLNPEAIRFLQQVASSEEVSSISHLLNAIVSGLDLSQKDYLAIEDYLMDRTAEIEQEGLEVPTFFEAIRNIVGRMMSSAPSTPSDGNSPMLPDYMPVGQQNQPVQGNRQRFQPKPQVKPRANREPKTPRISKKERYADSALTPDNIPQYLIDIHEIVNAAVEARLQDEIRRRVEAEEKLIRIQKTLGVL